MSEETIIILFDIDVLKARRVGRKMAEQIGFSEVEAHQVETVIAELATNLVKYRTIRGQITVRVIVEQGKQGIEVISTDKGPGIKNIEFAMEDGNSTSGTLGVGLSAVKRMMDDFSIESVMEEGTTIIAKKWLKTASRQKMNFSVIARPKTGEEVSGDAYFIFQDEHYAFVAVIDALGHGREAHEVAVIALEVIQFYYMLPLDDLLKRTHTHLKNSRGAAIAFCRIDFAERRIRHISIGNVETLLCQGARVSRLVCYNGTVGMAMENKQVNEYPFFDEHTLIMFTDGISGSFTVREDLLLRKPVEIASFILDNYKRGYDDETVLVGKFF